ncbi:hypothetical protein F5Y12DRAFT_768898 [Xylaria sp. FL1777]|nr:hypothetical protein F5Y12DRAFT_768898 [Xylaria sp. FL1777]
MFLIRNTQSLLRASSKTAAVCKPRMSSSPHVSNTGPNQHIIVTRMVAKAAPARLHFIAQQAAFATKPSNDSRQGIDTREERKISQHKLTPHPESVTKESSVRHLYEPSLRTHERPIKTGIRDDLKTVQETFSLSNTPREPYWLGLAGTLPYFGTSLSTVYLAWVLNTSSPGPSTLINNLMISPETASHLMATLEPIQLGYGAVIISFLGAVHWGLEYAEKVPDHTRARFRYGIGVAAPIFAWPTLFLPVEFALTSQFAAFVALYFTDARATVHGWAPAWYSTYRFALTAVVGVAIAISLIGRAKVGDARPRLTGLSEKFHEHRGEEAYTRKWQELEQKEVQNLKKQAKEVEKNKEKQKQHGRGVKTIEEGGESGDGDDKYEGGQEKSEK